MTAAKIVDVFCLVLFLSRGRFKKNEEKSATK
jgi:hypothetical protein